MRASDEDRRRTVEELRRHCAAGRLDVDEYASRVERALSASTLQDLDEVRADLPMIRIAEPAGGRVWAGGSRRGTGERVPARRGGGSDGPDGDRSAAARRMVAVGLAAITVAVVLAAIAMILAAEWVWALVLLAGWVVGMLQGRLARAGRRAGS